MRALVLAGVLFSLVASAQVASQSQTNYFPPENLLQNAGFERGLTKWASSGATPVVVTAGANLLFDKASITFDATATGQFVQSNLYTVPEGLKGRNCEGTIHYKGGDALLKLDVLDGSANLLASRTLAASTNTTRAGVIFPCPSSGSVRLRVESTGNAALIALDKATLGELVLVDTQSPQLVASAFKAGTTSCSWSLTSTSYTDFGTDADCPGITVDASSGVGQVVTTDDDLPQIVINNLPSGTYRITATFIGSSSAVTNQSFRLSDGAIGRGEQDFSIGTSAAANYALSATFTYGSAGNRTFKIQGRQDTGTTFLGNDNANRRLQFIVERIPDNQGAFRPDQVAWYVDGNIGTTGATNFALGTSSVSAYTEMTDGSMELTLRSGSIAAQIACSGTNPSTGTTCSAGSESNGVAFTVPSPGAVLACASFGHQVLASSGSVNAYFQVVETPNNAQTILQEGGARMQSYIENSINGHPVRVCGTFNFATAGLKTLRVMYEQIASGTISTNQVNADEGASLGQRDVKWEVYPITQAVPAPLLVNSVVSSAAGVTRVEAACFGTTNCNTICSASPCFVAQEGSWISSVTRASAGVYTVNFVAGTFSSEPRCTLQNRTGNRRFYGVNAHSASSISIAADDSAGTPADTAFSILCTGPR